MRVERIMIYGNNDENLVDSLLLRLSLRIYLCPSQKWIFGPVDVTSYEFCHVDHALHPSESGCLLL